MSEPAINERAEASVAADLLCHGASVHRLSAALTIVAAAAVPVLALVRPSVLAMALASLAVLAGLAEQWFALRVAFDARAFERLARGDSGDGVTLAAFDAAMRELGLIPADKAGRSVAARVRGAMRLLGRQLALLVVQVALFVAGGWLLVAING